MFLNTIPPGVENTSTQFAVTVVKDAAPLFLKGRSDGESETSIVLTEGFRGDELHSRCHRSWGHMTELVLEGSPEQPITTITGEDLKRLNDDPDLLFTLTKFSLLLSQKISAEDVTTFLCALEPMVNLRDLTLDIPLNDDQLIAILNRHTELNKLSLFRGELLTDRALSALAERGSQFDQLIIDSSSESMRHESISRLFSSLTNVSILWFLGKALIDESHLKAALSNKQIGLCRLSGCQMTPDLVKTVFEEIGEHAKLEKLNLTMPSQQLSSLFQLLSFSRKKTQVFRLNERLQFVVNNFPIIKV